VAKSKTAKPKNGKQKSVSTNPKADMEKFRLRPLVERLAKAGEVEIYEEKVALADVSPIIEATDKCVWFKKAGPEKSELVANVMGSRRRLAIAMGCEEDEVVETFQARLATPQPVFYVDKKDAPVQEVVLKGDKADLTKLPFHPQHEFDGSAYISSGIDFSIDPETGITNVGCRRLSLRNKHECGTNVTAPSDLQRIYRGCVARGEKLPINFAIGCHPFDYMASGLRIPTDEATLVGTLRGEPVPLVKGITNDVPVPADAEMVIEGYLDEKGYVEPEGPYGEYVGYYGAMHLDPVFHVTAITMRKDVMHQSLLHGSGPILDRMESRYLGAIRLEGQIRKLLAAGGVDVAKIHIPGGAAEGQVVRVAINQQRPGQARNVISTILGAIFSIKHVFVTDADVDITQDFQMDWAMVSRFQADKDIVIVPGVMGMPMDPSKGDGPTMTKAGFDLTMPMEIRNKLTATPSHAAKIEAKARYQTVEKALEAAGPIFFSKLMGVMGSTDGREIAVELDDLRRAGKLMRDENGRYLLGKAKKGTTGLTPEGLHHVVEEDPNRHVRTDKITITRAG